MFKAKKRVILFTALLAMEHLSCSSVQGASSSDPTSVKNQQMPAEKSSQTPSSANTSEPAKIQAIAQEEFARQLAKAGPKAEGWALFSDSPMSHNGQRWIIRSRSGKNEEIRYCVIEQGAKSCTDSLLTRQQFIKIQRTLNTADELSHILPKVFDGVSYEYLHAHSGNPQTKRVVFISSMKPFPAAYTNLIKAFEISAPPQKP